jgi:hypothetical protein
MVIARRKYDIEVFRKEKVINDDICMGLGNKK